MVKNRAIAASNLCHESIDTLQCTGVRGKEGGGQRRGGEGGGGTELSPSYSELSPSDETLPGGSEGSTYLQIKPKVLPMMFMMTADMAQGRETRGEVKWELARTTPKDEFCIPTWGSKAQNIRRLE